MSLRAMTWVMEEAPVTDPTELLVLYALADRAGTDGTAAWPAQSWLAERARCHVRTVKRKLADLETRDVIRRGDQQLVAHYRADRRPIVWNINYNVNPLGTPTPDTTTDTEPTDPTDPTEQTIAPGDADSATGHAVTPSGDTRGHAVTPSDSTGGHTCPSEGTHVSERGDTAVSYKPSLNPPKPSIGGGKGNSQLTTARGDVDSPSKEIPEAWIRTPRLSRCAGHLDVEFAPACGDCADVRTAALMVKNSRAAEQREADRARLAGIDLCQWCDGNGILHRADSAKRCTHDVGDAQIFLYGTATPELPEKPRAASAGAELAKRKLADLRTKTNTDERGSAHGS